MALYALVAYPLSAGFRETLEKQYSEPIHYGLIGEMRQQGFKGMMKLLRRWRGQLIIPLEDPQSELLLPLLILIASVTGCRKKFILYANQTVAKISLSMSIKAGWGLAMATLRTVFLRRTTARELSQLLQQPTLIFPIKAEANSVWYLNANLWFGIKAGGSVGHIAGVANALQEEGYRVNYLALERNPALNSDIVFSAVAPPIPFGLPYELNHYALNQRFIEQCKKLSEPVQFVYQRLSLASYAGVVVARHQQVPLVVEYNGSEVWIAEHWGRGLRYKILALQAENSCLQHATLIVTISNVLKEELMARGVSPHKIVCYPNGIDPTVFNPARYDHQARCLLREKHQIAPDALVLGFVGTFGVWHGVEILAEAIVRLVKHHEAFLEKHRLCFLWVGDGARMAAVKSILQQAHCEPYVRFVGLVPQAEAPRYLAVTDILLSPHTQNADGSRFFGSPTKLFEYMAMEKPIIASEVEQIGEILNNSLRIHEPKEINIASHSSALSILCRPGNPQDIVDAIYFLVENPQWQNYLGTNARREVLAHYTWFHHTQQILSHLKSVV